MFQAIISCKYSIFAHTLKLAFTISLSNQFNSSQVMSVNVKPLLDSIFIITTNIFNDFVRFTYKYASYLSIQQKKVKKKCKLTLKYKMCHKSLFACTGA